jgi:hypothetical protein
MFHSPDFFRIRVFSAPTPQAVAVSAVQDRKQTGDRPFDFHAFDRIHPECGSHSRVGLVSMRIFSRGGNFLANKNRPYGFAQDKIRLVCAAFVGHEDALPLQGKQICPTVPLGES